jgi:transposase
VYLRTLLIHGARSTLRHAKPSDWVAALAERRNSNLAAVALANKNARIVWALLAHGRTFQADYRVVRNQAA